MKTFMNAITRAGLSVLVMFLAFAPSAFAQSTGIPNREAADRLGNFLLLGIYIIDKFVVPLIFAIAFIVFIIGVYRYFVAGGANEEKRQEGQKFVLWGLIGFVIMFSVWGLINLLVTSLGFNGSTRPALPVFLQQNRGTTNGAVSDPSTLPSSSIQDSGTPR
jgi:hypothetical protein